MNWETVLSALDQQLACYQRLSKLAQIQHEHVQQGRTEELLEVLAQRQGVLDQIAVLETTIRPAKARWTEFIAEIPAEERGRAERLMAETRRLLEAITASDRNDSIVLQQRKFNIGRELGRASAAKQVNRTYATAAYGKRPASVDFSR